MTGRSKRSIAQLRHVFERSESWLSSLGGSEILGRTLRIRDVMMLAIGEWICLCILDRPGTSMRLVAQRVESKLRSVEGNGTFDPFAYDSKLILLMLELLTMNGCKSSAFVHFAEEVNEGFKMLGSTPTRFVGESLLLSHLGYVDPPAAPTLTAGDIGRGGRYLLLGTDSELRMACDAISAASLFGTHALNAETEVGMALRELLPCALFHTLRTYDLDLGARVLRTMRYSGLGSLQAFRLGTAFLVDQQESNGRFGRLTKEALALTESGYIAPAEVEARLYLPITVNCLWSLAECTSDDFTLFDSFWRRGGRQGALSTAPESN